MKKARIVATAAVFLLVLIFVAHARAQTVNRAERPQSAHGTPEMIYVADFAIDSSNISQQGRLLNRPRRMQEDSGTKAVKLVELLSASIVGELQRKSIPAKRLYLSQAVPDRGWLVNGQFLEVDEGNRLRRAMVGFGAGATDMQIEVAVTDLGSGRSQPFMAFGTDSMSGRGPGAVVMMNPYVAAAKFVLSKRASEKDVKKTARQIAGVLVKYIEEGGGR